MPLFRDLVVYLLTYDKTTLAFVASTRANKSSSISEKASPLWRAFVRRKAHRKRRSFQSTQQRLIPSTTCVTDVETVVNKDTKMLFVRMLGIHISQTHILIVLQQQLLNRYIFIYLLDPFFLAAVNEVSRANVPEMSPQENRTNEYELNWTAVSLFRSESRKITKPMLTKWSHSWMQLAG